VEYCQDDSPDFSTIVYEILETCTISDFRLFLKTFATNASLNDIMIISIEELLTNTKRSVSDPYLVKTLERGQYQSIIIPRL
jgi:hypothetical protein